MTYVIFDWAAQYGLYLSSIHRIGDGKTLDEEIT